MPCVLHGEPLARHTSWRIGGPADRLVDVLDEDELRAEMRSGPPALVLGAGSNLLVADAGVRGTVLRLAGALRAVRLGEDARGPWAEAGGGTSNAALLRRVARAGLAGLACLAGVPGTVGGAVRMNAGHALGEIGERVEHVDVVLPGGERVRLDAGDLAFGYRRARLPAGAVVAAVRLRLLHDPREPDRIAAFLARRRATQPLSRPSCGSVFRNPPGRPAAGWLLDRAGLKGVRRGGARVSPLHANFIVNEGGARAGDVRALVVLARRLAWARFGVVLEPEFVPAGEWPPGSWPLPHPAGS